MAKIPLEDTIEDVLGKAVAGLKLSTAVLADQSGLTADEVKAALAGDVTEAHLDAICPLLKLSADKLKRRLAGNEERPDIKLPDGAAAFTTPFPVPGYAEMTVNAYLLWDASTRQAVAFDCGGDATEMLEVLNRHNLKLEAILVTHTHKDHIAALEDLIENTDRPAVWVNHAEPLEGATTFSEGKMWQIGCMMIRAIDSHGHSPGGTTFYVEGLDESIAVAGDAIFASSVGGAPNSWDEALTAIDRKSVV